MNMLTAILLQSRPCRLSVNCFLSPYIPSGYKSPSPTFFSLAKAEALSMRVSPFSLLSSVACCVAVYSVCNIACTVHSVCADRSRYSNPSCACPCGLWSVVERDLRKLIYIFS